MKLLIIGKIWPEPSSSAAGSRMLQLVDTFLDYGWQVSFASVAKRSDYSFLPEADDFKSFHIELNSPSFDSFVKDLHPSIVLFDRFSTEEQFGWRVALNCPGALRVLDTEDLHGLREARHKALKENRAFETKDLINDIAKRELASIYRCDLTLIISEYEMELLHGFFKVDSMLLLYLPFLPEPLTPMQIAAWRTFSARKNFISIGNFLHAPNLDATLFLKQRIWPRIREWLPEVEMEVYGAYPSSEVLQMHDPSQGFLMKGRAEQVAPVMGAARLCLAPLRFGAGLKGKLIDAMQHGTPSITTGIGSEGMQGGMDWCGEVADDPLDFAAAAVALYRDEERWTQASQQGALIHRTVFESKGHQQKLVSTLRHLLQNLDRHRAANFTGSMLLHQSLLSTKYMALWIEAKNKI